MPSKIKSLGDVKNIFCEQFTQPIFFISPDPLLGVGLEKIIPNYHIVCLDDSPIVPILKKAGVKVFCLEKILGEKNIIFRSSRHLLSHPKTIEYLKKCSENGEINLIFFKPYFQAKALIQKIEPSLKVRVLNNSPTLNKIFEDKVSFHQLSKNLDISLPKSLIIKMQDIDYYNLQSLLGKKFVIQFSRGWAGNTTFFIKSNNDLKNLRERFPYPKLLVKAAEYIESETLINNACITKFGTLVSHPFLQITGLKDLTVAEGGTCGNEWEKADIDRFYTDEILQQTQLLGNYMKKLGLRGIFGLDILLDKNKNNIYISENNARITASVPLYTKFELKSLRIPLLIFHLIEFLPIEYKIDFAWMKNQTHTKISGAQLVVRNTHAKPLKVTKTLEPGVYRWEDNKGLNFIKNGYCVDDLSGKQELLVLPVGKQRLVNPGIEMLRIQTLGSILEDDLTLKAYVLEAVQYIKAKLGLTCG